MPIDQILKSDLYKQKYHLYFEWCNSSYELVQWVKSNCKDDLPNDQERKIFDYKLLNAKQKQAFKNYRDWNAKNWGSFHELLKGLDRVDRVKINLYRLKPID